MLTSRKTAISAWFWNPCSGVAHFLPVFTEDLFSEARHFPIWRLGLFLLRSPPVCPVNGSLELYCGLQLLCVASLCGPKAPRGQDSLPYSWVSVFHCGSPALWYRTWNKFGWVIIEAVGKEYFEFWGMPFNSLHHGFVVIGHETKNC